MHNLCFFIILKITFYWNYFLIAAIKVATRGPLYTCLVIPEVRVLQGYKKACPKFWRKNSVSAEKGETLNLGRLFKFFRNCPSKVSQFLCLHLLQEVNICKNLDLRVYQQLVCRPCCFLDSFERSHDVSHERMV